MKRLIAILLLCCFTLYHFGYYAFYFSYQARLEADWTNWISEGGSDPEERVLSIPVSIPYLEAMNEFYPINTSFEKDGQHYRAIKQRYVGDEIQVVYVRDTAKGNLDYTLKVWVHSLVKSDIPDNGGGNHVKLFAKDYSRPDNTFGFSTDSFLGPQTRHSVLVFTHFEEIALSLDGPPPQGFFGCFDTLFAQSLVV